MSMRMILFWATSRDGSAEQDDEALRSIEHIASEELAEQLIKDKQSLIDKYRCPICGEQITLTGERTKDGRLIGSCLDAFTVAQWIFD